MKKQILRFILYVIMVYLTGALKTAVADLNVGEPRMVRLIYFLPSDRSPQQDIDTKLDALIRDVQQFYADEMERYNLGRKTFTFETDATGKAVVHPVDGQFTDLYYRQNTFHKVWEEIREQFYTPQNIYFIAIDIGSERVGRGYNEVCGVGDSHGASGGHVLIPASSDCFNLKTAAHELGHAFELQHDFRSDTYIMSFGRNSNKLSECAAEWLAAQRYFNTGQSQTHFDTSTTIRMLSPLASPPYSIRFRFEVTDPDGAHQAQLLTPATIRNQDRGQPKLLSCKRLNGETDTIEIELITNQLKVISEYGPEVTLSTEVTLSVIDMYGNFTSQTYPIDITTILPTETASTPNKNRSINILEPVPPPFAVRQAFELDPFYQQWTDVEGLPVVSSAKVNPYALKEAAWLIWKMIGHRSEILHVWVQKRVRFVVIGHTEIPTDIPDYSDSGPDFLVYLTRGFGGGGLSGHTAVSAPEEKLLHYPGSNSLYSVVIHEVGHVIHRFGLNTIDPTFDNRLQIVYDAAMEKGLWRDTYASSNKGEYWAEATHAWFYPKGVGSFSGNTREALKAYDPGVAALLTEVYGDSEWRYTPLATRTHLPHLQGFDPQDSPTFQGWPELDELVRQFRNPNSDGGDKWVNLRPYDPNLLLSLNESRTTGTRTHISFMNLTQTDVLVYEVGQDGTEWFWTRTRPGTWYISGTPSKTNAIWLIKDLNGRNIAAFQAVEQPGRAIIETNPIFITPGLSKVSGDNQKGVSGAVLANPFVIEVRNENLSVLEGISVTFTVTAGGGTLNFTRAITNKNGAAQSTLTLGPNPGTNTVTVSVTGIQEEQTFTAEGIRILKTLEIVSGDDQEGLPGAALDKAFVVEVGNQSDNPLPEVQVTFTVTAGGGTLSTTRTMTDENGRAESTLTLGPNLGTNTVEVSAAGIEQTVTFNAVAEVPLDIPDPNLRAVVETALGKASGAPITVDEMANLTGFAARNANINDLTGLEHAINLKWLGLDGETVGGTWNNSNSISDLSPLAGLTNLTQLWIGGNSISDISPLAGLTNLTSLTLEVNRISDISPLVANIGLGEGDTVYVRANPLNSASIKTHIPTLLGRGVTVEFDDVTPQKIRIVSGNDQQGLPGAALDNPFVVEVRDQTDKPLPDAQVTFSVSSGDGTLSATSVTTDSNGRAESTLTLGPNPGTNTVSVSVTGIQAEQMFTAEGIRIPLAFWIISGDKQQGLTGESLAKPFVVEVRDRSGEPLSGAQVTFSVTGGGGTLSGTNATTDSSGRAESTLTLGPNPGTNTISVSVTGIQAEQMFTAEGIRIPETLEIISGKDQEGLPGEALAKPFVVEVRDRSGEPLLGAQVTFSVTGGGGTLSGTNATTDSNGRAESTLTLGPNPGTNTVTVSVTGIQAEQMFTAEGIRIPLAFWIISGDKQQGQPGEALAKPFLVEVRDRSGEPLPGAQVTFSVTSGGGTLSVTSATTDSGGRAESILTLGPNLGTNTVIVSVTGILEEQSISATAEPPPIPQDVNRDDVVNILDLVLVASDLGDEGADLAADVNGDGVVNILDLVLVAGVFGDAAAAPSVDPRALAMLTAVDVGQWLAQAQTLDLTDAASREGVLVLEQLLAVLAPKETILLPNYPNPFNPETWIPYQLAENASVTLTIYDMTGVVVRRLDLGHRLAGYYTNRGKAAHWDGRNESGEPVASGVYFYQLATPSFRDLRRLVILK